MRDNSDDNLNEVNELLNKLKPQDKKMEHGFVLHAEPKLLVIDKNVNVVKQVNHLTLIGFVMFVHLSMNNKMKLVKCVCLFIQICQKHI